MKLGDLSITYIEVMADTLLAAGHSPKPLLEQYGIVDETLATPDARISIPRFMRMGFDAIQRTGQPEFGLLMGQHTWPAHLGLAGLLAAVSKDMRSACQAIAGFELLSSYNSRGASQFGKASDLSAEDRESRAPSPVNPHPADPALRFYSISPYNDYNLFVVDSVLAGWTHVLEVISGRPHQEWLQRIDIEFPAPRYQERYARTFQVPVNFNAGHNQLVFQRDAMDLPVLQHSASMHARLHHQATSELERVRLGLSVAEKVARAIGPLLNGQTPELADVATRLNTAPWTLRRRLQSEGLTYKDVLNNTRRSLAESYVRDTDLTLGEIAYLLGFGSAAAFQRAFKRWTGEPPGRYREIRRSGGK
ncbi:MAG: AraC family transcriptional regulator [Pseudomonadota bacterium]|nr:AraC family transcriptional regulator [Pseudomonadota bacterium]